MSAKPVPDRLLPHCEPSEKAAIGSCIMEPGCTAELISYGIRPEHFYDVKHRNAYKILLEMDAAGLPIDPVSFLSEAMTTEREKDIGGTAYLSELMAAVTTTINLGNWADTLKEKYQCRQVIIKCTQLVEVAYVRTDKIDGLLEQVENSIRSMRVAEVDESSLCDVGQDIETALEEAGKGNVPGIRSGLTKLDDVIGGFQNGDLITLAGRPGSGKSSLATTIIENVSINDRHHVTIFSLEMNRHEIGGRIISSISGLNIQAGLRGKWGKWEDWSDEYKALFKDGRVKFGKSPLRIVCAPRMTITQLVGKARLIKESEKTELVIVDYLQAVNATPGIQQNRSQIVSEIARSLKNLAMELNVPVIALAQLNREVDKENRAPKMSDLKESSGIEEASNIVGLIHPAPSGKETKDGVLPVDLLIAKSRHGDTSTVKLGFKKRITKFVRDPDETMDTDYLPTQEPETKVPYRDY